MCENEKNTKLYLELLKKCILNEIYLEDELRIYYLKKCIEGKFEYQYEILHDIRNRMNDEYAKFHFSRLMGRFYEREIHNSGFNHSMIGRKRMDNLHASLKYIYDKGIEGDVIECGVWRGGATIFMAGFLKAYEIDKKVFVADSFQGLPKPSVERDLFKDLSADVYPELAVSLNEVKNNFEQYDLLSDKVCFLKGWFKDTLSTSDITALSLLRMDGDYFESTMDILTNLYDKVVKGGIIIVDDYGLPRCKDAIISFFADRGELFPDVHDIDGMGVWWYR